ncbi:TrbC/VirB2 family protein [Burkholderia gladioli pv. gladioli]|uniref:Conjugal transfer protein TraC n=1 Tax=Burkholderia gladioli TaxID=28095 RepID=A0A095G2A6_BURGA|nr:TrbC/VirB2 family protein [Burkholderia gladioli]AJX00678.1 trbC/VIRB2 family protein [Burkholderia gladioli]ASD80035.1 conjugal transfer protein TraC [Burkholderia gladioli pv. gladioli]AWY54718.1 conjugal transfer protein TraC [Burkholderia gladioli pv. gladioli]KGC11507.1 trbC/VIRB2 family protein [Burkholderia gladioli]MDJ1160316.1 TrbC/VirB2 family protein [Burkholderia gladioli pv. gladioli]
MKSGLQIKWRSIPRETWIRESARAVRRGLAIASLLALTVTPAYAQLSQVNTLLTTIQTTLLSVGAVVCSISIIWAGFKMMFQHARFGDIANVFIGGLFVGCATVIAAMLIPTS